ncbi:hypothetical protein ACET3X_008636 [Alternaria dauci]|uniref:Heterokaryon incompatibility domain-containing protein n=1 Tax=Alternaria dauci TaxID=48095 RepID=A0ABR3UDF3_9PLEO
MSAASATCNTCHHFANGYETSVSIAGFLLSAGNCQGCSIIRKALDAVTDIRRPEFKTIKIRRKEAEDHWHFLDPKNVLHVQCEQEGKPYGGRVLFGQQYVDSRPNDYEIYTPISAGEDSAIPWLGLRNGPKDRYREQSNNLEDRLNEARIWYEDCKSNHPLCVPRKDGWPRRILDLTADSVRLVNAEAIESTSSQQQEGYACLSYAWGTTGNLKTLTDNLQSHMEGIDVDTLPRTLFDAVHVARAFGLRYLWIDALCIIQDDVQDWMDQIPRMSSIYQGAELVISAQGASNVKEGFLSLAPAANAPLKRIEVPFHMSDGTSRVVKLSIRERETRYSNVPAHHSSRPMVGDDVDIDDLLVPLTTRAWVFQETFLARRILYATPSELAWECSNHERCECRVSPSGSATLRALEFDDYGSTRTLGQIIRADSLRSAEKSPGSKLKLWAEVVRRYSDKNLTKWTDRLAAIQGVVQALAQAMPGDFDTENYIFGLWKPNLERYMLWNRHPRTPGDSEITATLRQIAPSWSWVTNFGGVMYYDSVFEPNVQIHTHVIRIERGESNTLETTIFGAGDCTLTLFGFCIPVHVEPLYLQLAQEDPQEEDNLEAPFVFPENYAAEWNDGPSVIDMIPDDPTDKTVFDRVTHFVPLVSGPPSDEENPRLQYQGLFLEMVVGPEEEKEPYDWEYEGVTHDIKFEGTFKRVGFGYDYSSQVHLHSRSTKDYIGQLRAFKLV